MSGSPSEPPAAPLKPIKGYRGDWLPFEDYARDRFVSGYRRDDLHAHILAVADGHWTVYHGPLSFLHESQPFGTYASAEIAAREYDFFRRQLDQRTPAAR